MQSRNHRTTTYLSKSAKYATGVAAGIVVAVGLARSETRETSWHFWAPDVVANKVIDIDDVKLMATHWLQAGYKNSQSQPGPDFNGDGTVNLIDFGFLSANWQKQRPYASIKIYNTKIVSEPGDEDHPYEGIIATVHNDSDGVPLTDFEMRKTEWSKVDWDYLTHPTNWAGVPPTDPNGMASDTITSSIFPPGNGGPTQKTWEIYIVGTEPNQLGFQNCEVVGITDRIGHSTSPIKIIAPKKLSGN